MFRIGLIISALALLATAVGCNDEDEQSPTWLPRFTNFYLCRGEETVGSASIFVIIPAPFEEASPDRSSAFLSVMGGGEPEIWFVGAAGETGEVLTNGQRYDPPPAGTLTILVGPGEYESTGIPVRDILVDVEEDMDKIVERLEQHPDWPKTKNKLIEMAENSRHFEDWK
jgi:hypothetical protein